MNAIKNLNFVLESKATPAAIIELGELELDLVGGGTGDVIAPTPPPVPSPAP